MEDQDSVFFIISVVTFEEFPVICKEYVICVRKSFVSNSAILYFSSYYHKNKGERFWIF